MILLLPVQPQFLHPAAITPRARLMTSLAAPPHRGQGASRNSSEMLNSLAAIVFFHWWHESPAFGAGFAFGACCRITQAGRRHNFAVRAFPVCDRATAFRAVIRQRDIGERIYFPHHVLEEPRRPPACTVGADVTVLLWLQSDREPNHGLVEAYLAIPEGNAVWGHAVRGGLIVAHAAAYSSSHSRTLARSWAMKPASVLPWRHSMSLSSTRMRGLRTS